jgi:hypothetical protein
MMLTADQIDAIRYYGGALTPIRDVAVLMGVDPDELADEIACVGSPAYSAYHAGRAETELNIRRTEITMATAGSPLAIQHVKGYIDDLVDRNS